MDDQLWRAIGHRVGLRPHSPPPNRPPVPIRTDDRKEPPQREPMPMPAPYKSPIVEIKGLSNAMAGVRDGIRGVRSMVASLNESAGGLSAELKDVQAQIEQARDDLKFEASTLGNSAPSSETP